MQTEHRIYYSDARNLRMIKDASVDLVVTSPPYPMIAMWDQIFGELNEKIKTALENQNGDRAFSLMHTELNKTWDELCRIMKPGAIACINTGDATRKIGDTFRLYSNHTAILNHFLQKGFHTLPNILWRKQTNSPNKFMGSGMLPPGAYVTLEHEYILILRKGAKREFKSPGEKENRYESAYFWEERNHWFSDIWEDLKGANQSLSSGTTRNRSAAYPFELPYRLINMFSVKNDTVFDPFLGTGTSMLAAIASGRNSIGTEIDENLKSPLEKNLSNNFKDFANDYTLKRLQRHQEFINKRHEEGKTVKYQNRHHNFSVISAQEEKLKLNLIKEITTTAPNYYTATYTSDFLENNNYDKKTSVQKKLFY